MHTEFDAVEQVRAEVQNGIAVHAVQKVGSVPLRQYPESQAVQLELLAVVHVSAVAQ